MNSSIVWSRLRYPCDDPENGPARANPVNGCVECASKEADSYFPSGLCDTCGAVRAEFRGATVHVTQIVAFEDRSVGIGWTVEDFVLVRDDGSLVPVSDLETITEEEYRVISEAVWRARADAEAECDPCCEEVRPWPATRRS